MSSGADKSLFRKGAAASLALLVVFLAAWQWGPGLLGILLEDRITGPPPSDPQE